MMEYDFDKDDLFVRIESGESIVASITKLAIELKISSAAIVSGVGMLSHATLGFYHLDQQKYAETEFDDIYDLSVVIGNISLLDGKPWTHVHVVFNDPDHRTFSGHLLEATCHITTELFFSTNRLELERRRIDGCPVPLITKR